MSKVLALRNQGNKLPLILALLLGLLAAVLTAVYLSSAGNDGGESATVITSPALVAAQDIPANTRVTKDMLKVQFLPADEVNPEAFTAYSQVIDRVATQDVAAGEQIVPTQVSSSAGEGVSFVVQPGYRAISVEVREVVAVGGNLEPGDHVDVVGIFELADVQSANLLLQNLGLDYQVAGPSVAAPEGVGGQANLVLTATMLQNVRLLALSQSLTEETAGGNAADDAAENEPNPSAATATLELTPQQAQELTWADQFGTLRMVGRAVGDDAIVPVVPTLSGKQIVKADEVVQADNLADTVPIEKEAIPCEILNCGLRAISVRVAPATAAAGLIRPGDRVDVIAAFKDGSAVMILQDVEVLSIDQELETLIAVPATEGDGEERQVVSEGEVKPMATTATLAVWPDEVMKLAAAEEMTDKNDDCLGSLRLSLRHTDQPGTFVMVAGQGFCAYLFALAWGLDVGPVPAQLVPQD